MSAHKGTRAVQVYRIKPRDLIQTKLSSFPTIEEAREWSQQQAQRTRKGFQYVTADGTVLAEGTK